jgi:predicted GNAT family N-acyltransferase
MNNPLLISRANLSQVDALVALIQSAYRGDESLKGWTTETHLIDGPRITAQEMADAINDPEIYVLVGHDQNQRLIGCAAVAHEGEGTCSFGKFAVSPHLQGGGTGKLILAAGEDIARTHFRADRMVMTVIDGRTELEAFYRRRGYVLTGKKVAMSDIFQGEIVTRGLDLILNEYAKPL